MASLAPDGRVPPPRGHFLPSVREWGGALLLGALFFAFAASSIAHLGTNTPLWFCNAGAVVWLLQVPGRRWPLLLASVWVADSLAIHFYGAGIAPLMAIADMAEVLLTAWLIRHFGGAAALLTSVPGLVRLVLIFLAVPALTATWGVSVLLAAEGGAFLASFLQWYAATSLGMLIVCPALLIWLTPGLHPDLDRQAALQLGLLGAALAAVAFLALNVGKPALLFALFPALLLLVWHRGLAGASVGSAVIAVVGTVATLGGADSIRMLVLPDTSAPAQILAVQMLLGMLSLSSLPLAVVLADQARLAVQLRRVAEARREFLAAMSHEIRTPMTAVLGIVDLLEGEQPTDRQKSYLASIRSSGRHLLSIINDILDFSRLETGKIELEKIDFSLAELFVQLQSLLSPLASERRLQLWFELPVDSPPMVRGDPTRLRQVILNLAGNAIKFTPAGSVTVSGSYREHGTGKHMFRFEVRDTGIGIDPAKQAELFSAFTQADNSTSRRYGGSGLGLAISKRLIAAMDGAMGVESMPGEGSLFWFEVPLEEGQPTATTAAARRETAPPPPRRVLLVEDVDLNRDIISMMLERDGHQVEIAKNGLDAVAMVKAADFDLVLMDVHMPIMDGLQATRLIRAMPPDRRDVPVVALTANVMAAEQEKCLGAGMNDVLMKPVEWDQMRAVLHRYGPRGETVPGPGERGPESFDAAIFERLAALLPPARLRSHVRQLRSDVRALAAAGPGSAPKALGEAAHKIVSQAGMVGLTRLSRLAAGLEQACLRGECHREALAAFAAASADLDQLPNVSASSGARISRQRPRSAGG